MRTTVSPCISALNVHPTPQYAQVVSTVRRGCPISMTVFSVSVAVGQACTQAPHDTHSLSKKLPLNPAATREPKPYGAELARWIAFGASPRGTIALDRCARAHAWLAGRDYVSPEDVHAVAADVLRHRVLMTYEAEAEGISSDHAINLLLERVPLP